MSASITLGNLTIDRGTYMVWVDGTPVDLTYIEFEVLYALARNSQRVTSRESLAQTVWGDGSRAPVRNLTVHISRLRKKLKASHPYAIRTIPKRGYSMANADQSSPPPEVAAVTRA